MVAHARLRPCASCSPPPNCHPSRRWAGSRRPRPGWAPSCAAEASTSTSSCPTTATSRWSTRPRSRARRSRRGSARRRFESGDHPTPAACTWCRCPGIARSAPVPAGQRRRAGPTTTERFFRFAAAVAAFVERRPARRPAPQRLAHRRGARRARPTRRRRCCRSTTSPTRASTDGVVARPPSGRGPAHYEWWGGTNPLSGAIALADAHRGRVADTTPARSSRPEGGFGLDGPLRDRGDALIGILNGIDTDVWDPATDPLHRRARSTAPTLAIEAATPIARRCTNGSGSPIDGVAARRRGHPPHRTRRASTSWRRWSRCSIRSRCASPSSAPATPASPSAPPTRSPRRIPSSFAFVEGYDEALSHLLFAGGDLLPHAEPVRAVRAHPDAGDALRHDPGRHRRRRAARHGRRRRRRTGDGTGFVAERGDARRRCSRRCSAPRVGCATGDGAAAMQQRIMAHRLVVAAGRPRVRRRCYDTRCAGRPWCVCTVGS